ncbi:MULTISPECIES: N-acetylmuramoyl-L-alanine amidase [Actibacterium]|uniref:N-acetylmuramoyl-L-alanine amidase n=1 Tax=Actibacterium naphthalenivorans TaxID=1614693 RepID=A0A840C786_9RHOB|nr:MULTISPECIES: N-acetylmuramoyl-L-alanine amidase [Actibacterium]MBB4020723.1 N-acetylmuramoyl-L-alanine amidase [Actibacterium naphthalenivorans]
MGVLTRPSPNFGERRNGARPDLIVLHYTAMNSADAALDRLCDPASEVSAHYLIAENGTLCQLVREENRAWHAGAGAWGAVGDVNSRSIGIELANDGDTPFPEPQMAALERLLAGAMARWAIPPERVIAHSDMAPNRKIDPGARFDWRRLALQGLSVWPAHLSRSSRPDTPNGAFLTAARRFGYTADCGEDAILAAFRLRFRPGATGPLEGADLRAIQALAQRFPVDQGPRTA